MTKIAKTASGREFIFKMDAYSVGTLPMNRLAEYMQDLAIIFGERDKVHFVSLKRGSVALKIRVESEAEPKVRSRIRRCRQGEGPPEAATAVRKINRRLADDNASGELLDPGERRIIPFPGRKVLREPTIGPVKQSDSLDGVPIRVGGTGQNVPVHLEDIDGKIHMCTARRIVAQQIAKYMFETPLRADGIGSWIRYPDGEWEMQSFQIHEFHEVDAVNFVETVQRLRSIDLHIEPDENLQKTMAEIRSGS